MRKAIILAGGFGTRLQPLTFARPKHMLPLVDKPMLRHIVDYLIENDFEEIWISIGSDELFKEIEEYFEKKQLKANIHFIKEPKKLGGVGAIKYAMREAEIDDTFALILGDNITDIELNDMFLFHKKNPGIATIALVHTKTPWMYGVVELKDDNIISFVEKPPIGEESSNLIATGIYIMEPKIINYLPDEFMDSTGMLFPLLLKQGECINGFKSDKFWVDVGKPSSYLEATARILGRYGETMWVEEGVNLGRNTELIGPVVIFSGSEIGNNCKIKNSVIFQNNIIGDNCEITDSILDIGCKIGDGVKVTTTLGKGSILDNNDNN